MDVEKFQKISENSIVSLENLSKALDISESEIQRASNTSSNYQITKKPKIDGSERKIYKPKFLIRKIQGRINDRILGNKYIISWPNYLFGSIPKQNMEKPIDHISCAAKHCGSRSILKIDVKNFFDNIHEDIVFDVFKGFLKYSCDVSETLTKLCTHDNHLPQGALTSSFIANLALYDIEHNVVRKLSYKGLTYTRFVDDITISSKSKNYNFTYAKKLVEEMLYSKGLPINEQKTQEFHSFSTTPLIHGLRVNFKEPRLPKKEIKSGRTPA